MHLPYKPFQPPPQGSQNFLHMSPPVMGMGALLCRGVHELGLKSSALRQDESLVQCSSLLHSDSHLFQVDEKAQDGRANTATYCCWCYFFGAGVSTSLLQQLEVIWAG